MINPVAEVGRENEPLALRHLTKNQIYTRLSNEFILPAKDSRAVSRAYLCSIHQGTVFRVERHLMLQFEANLQMDELARGPAQNVTLVIERTNGLLRQLQRQQLGFAPGCYPDEGFLFRIVRYIDRTNLLGIFRRAVREAIAPNILANQV